MASCHAAADRRDIRECAGRCIKTLHFYGCNTAASDYTCFLHGDQLVNSRTCATCNRHALCCFNPKRRTSGHRAAHQCAKFLRGPPVDRVCQRGAGDTPTVPQPLTSSLAGRWAPLATAFLNTVDLSSLLKLFGDVSASLGFPRFAISRVSRRHTGNGRAMAVETLCARYPDHWVAHYAQRDYGPVDPVHRMAFARATPYRWADIRGLNRIEQRVLGEARDAGLTSGVSIPLRETNGDILLVNLASPSPEIKTEVHMRLASSIGALFHQELHRLMKPRWPEPALELSPRQQECLAWVARGKSSWAIAAIVGISPHTVDYHIAEAMKILGINSRTAAAVHAVTTGLIHV
ncbi:LuxR family transcriptional regulator [Burkholderia cenocepacia]|nr:LuxR family transcriptional regulator [Burkholderia cenocepacia]MDS0801896.1 LuxR family transcriptional regulator [Burkholderia cenocepacia]